MRCPVRAGLGFMHGVVRMTAVSGIPRSGKSVTKDEWIFPRWVSQSITHILNAWAFFFFLRLQSKVRATHLNLLHVPHGYKFPHTLPSSVSHFPLSVCSSVWDFILFFFTSLFLAPPSPPPFKSSQLTSAELLLCKLFPCWWSPRWLCN